jgi:hypothetical protein
MSAAMTRRESLLFKGGAREQLGEAEMRYIWLIGILVAVLCRSASATDLWTFNGRCKDSYVKQGSPWVDMTNIRGSAVSCDAASIITELDNGRILVQFVQKRGKMMPPGFAGGELKNTEGNYSLIVDRVYQQRPLVGKPTEQIYSEGGKTSIPAEGYCSFGDSDFSKLTSFYCLAKTINVDTKIVHKVVFLVDDILVKRNLQGSTEKLPAAPNTKDHKFDRIFQYIIFNQTLPDGKHPVWLYYQSSENIVRIDMPSLDLCVVTPRSVADLDVIKSRSYVVVPTGTKDWDFALEIWQTAFRRYLIVGNPKPC